MQNRSIRRQSEMMTIHQEVIVRRADVNVAFPDRFFIVNLDHWHLRVLSQERGECIRVVLAPVLNHPNRKRKILG